MCISPPPFFIDHLQLETPDEKAKIWRYMDFKKFESLVSKRTLFFVRGDKLLDKYEGAIPGGNFEVRVSHPLMPEGFAEALRKLHGNSSKVMFNWTKEWVFINCWVISNYESDAMWKLYAKSDQGIAIQSTFKNFTECLNKIKELKIDIGKVKYIDYEKDWMPASQISYPYFHKRKYFEHENELRALTVITPDMVNIKSKFDPSDSGIYIPINTDKLIEKIYIPSMSEEWFRELVESVMKKYNLEKEIVQSQV